ncbi:nuclear transport factor 2 family protein [Paenibacillus sp. NPDC058071]|uniref:nuclear transport factor 2 family protein n=1 Tax=Paenibacillus sp. NPDC058071 TaxID=3346326 RepID=UPI0036D7950E
MREDTFTDFEALDPFFEIVQKGLSGIVDGEHYFDTIAEDAVFEFLYNFPGWPPSIQGRVDLMALYSGYGHNIKLHSSDNLVVHHSQDSRVVILEYAVHGTILASGVPYDNRFVSIVTIENRKIVHWRDYMDSLAAWNALTSSSK